jgi:solute carrier family 39 (zinc transporter), member 1/2/3
MLFDIFSVVSIFLTGLIGGLLPTRVPETPGGQRLLVLSNALAGGIFFGAALIHLWPDSMELLASGRSGLALLLPFLLGAAGFLSILLLEDVLLGSEDVGKMSADRHAIYPYVLTLVLSVHSIIAGTALGLETGTVAAFALLVAILAHKAFAGLALGISLSRAGIAYRRHVSIIVLFALSTPTGVVLGILLSNALQGEAAGTVEGVIDALAAGTFLYVAVMDIISETFEEKGDRGLKYLMIVAGLALMLLLLLLE